jgi:hypothetical protein
MAYTPTIYCDRSLAVRRASYDSYLWAREQTKEITGSRKENDEKLAAICRALEVKNG